MSNTKRSSGSNNNNKADLPVNPHAKLNIDLTTLTAQNKNQFAAVGENESNSQVSKKFNNRPVDDYGRGAPTDRLTFGYAPSVLSEAVAFHSQFTPKQWKLERRLRYRNRCLRSRALYFQEVAGLASGAVKKEKVLNFEPDTSAIKLRLYWIEKLEEEKRLLAGGSGDDDITTSKQNTASGNSNNNNNASSSSNNQKSKTNNSSGNNNNKDGNFGQLLSDMFGGEYSSTNNKESGKRRQREE